MRWFHSFVAIIPLLFGLIVLTIPAPAAAQEEQGQILLTVRICSTPASEVAWFGAFSDASTCEGFVGGDGSTPMVLTLDGGQFIDGDVPGGSTLTLPFASMLNANLYLTPGDYTLTITFQQPLGDLVSTSTGVHIVAGETLPLTFTAFYALEFGVEPNPIGTPDSPIDQPEGPVTSTEVPAESVPQAADGSGIEASGQTADALNSTSITTLPRTGTGPSGNRGSLALASTVIAAFAFIASAAAIRTRR